MMPSNLKRNGQLSEICLNRDNSSKIDRYVIKSEKKLNIIKTLRIDIIIILIVTFMFVVIYWCALYDSNLYFIIFYIYLRFSLLVLNQVFQLYEKIVKRLKKRLKGKKE